MAINMENRWMDALGASEGSLREAREFDPRQALGRYARGAYQQFEEDLGENITDLRGQQVSMGRLDTGFATRDEDRLVEGMTEDLNRRLLRASLQTAGMRQGQLQQGANRYLDLLTGVSDRKARQKRRRGGLFGGLGALAGGLAGTFLLPGVGTAAGAQIGGALGQGVGGY